MPRPKDGPAVRTLKILERALAKAERTAQRRATRKANWSDPAEKAAYLREYKRNKRNEHVPEDRVCRGCKETVASTRRWVRLSAPIIFDGQQCWAVCRSCAMRHSEWNKPKACAEAETTGST